MPTTDKPSDKELEEKYRPKLAPLFVLKGLQGCNWRLDRSHPSGISGHPPTIGPRHVAYASDHCGGILGGEVFNAAGGCAYSEGRGKHCGLPYEAHVCDKVLFIQLTRHCQNEEATALLQPLGKEMEADGIDGLVFVETPEKFRINSNEQTGTGDHGADAPVPAAAGAAAADAGEAPAEPA